MNSYLDIILAPIITEKSAGMEAEGKYAFKVANTANKTLQLDDFYVSGLTLLSKDVSPGMAGSNFKIEDFAVNAETVTFNTDNKLVETLEKLTNILE